jgi:hypothetical protein
MLVKTYFNGEDDSTSTTKVFFNEARALAEASRLNALSTSSYDDRYAVEEVEMDTDPSDPYYDLANGPASARSMVTYAHSAAPLGARFRDFEGNEPSWAVDIQPTK